MGTDIYEAIEIRRNGIWEFADLLPPLDTDKSFSDPEWEAYWSHPAYVDRNYRLFSVLADVRNSFGIKPIAPPLGLPVDASEDSQRKYARYILNPNLTWISLRELLEYD